MNSSFLTSFLLLIISLTLSIANTVIIFRHFTGDYVLLAYPINFITAFVVCFYERRILDWFFPD
jgi:hypothetical protein